MNWDWEEIIGGTVLGCVFLVFITVLSVLTFAPKNVDYYYLSEFNNGSTCVYAHWTWHGDEKAFCGPKADALDFAEKANAILKSSVH